MAPVPDKGKGTGTALHGTIGDNGRMSHTIRIVGTDQRFMAEAGDTLLNAAGHAGLALPWRCADGSCGSCRCQLRAGECELIGGARLQAVTGGDAVPVVRMCQACPRSNLVLAPVGIRRVEDVVCREFTLELVSRESLSASVVKLVFEVRDGPSVRWLAGQYVELRGADGRRRPFSIANASRGDGRIEMHVRHEPGASFNRHLYETLHVGMQLQAEGPLGTFVPRENSARPILFVAGGTGMAPIKAVIEHFAVLGSHRPMQLYWGTRHPRELYLDTLIEAWSQEIPQLRFVPVVSDARVALDAGVRRGMVLDAVLADHSQLAPFDVYVCGPPAMVEAAIDAFTTAGLPRAQLFFDSYEYAPDVLAEILAQRAGLRSV